MQMVIPRVVFRRSGTVRCAWWVEGKPHGLDAGTWRWDGDYQVTFPDGSTSRSRRQGDLIPAVIAWWRQRQ